MRFVAGAPVFVEEAGRNSLPLLISGFFLICYKVLPTAGAIIRNSFISCSNCSG